MKDFVILGGNVLLSGVYLRLKERGYRVIVIDWNESPALKGDLHLQIDVKDTKTVVDVLKQNHFDVSGAFTSIDLAVPTISAIHKAYGLKFLPPKFDVVLSKEQMRQDWETAGIFNRLSKNSEEISLEQVIEYNRTKAILIKPDVAASSRGITTLAINSCEDDIESAIRIAKEASYNDKCLIEEYVKGREFTVDMLGDDYGNVIVYGISVKYHSRYTNNNRVAVKLHWNSDAYNDDIYRKIAEFGKECYRACGIKNAYGHLEIIMKEDDTFTPIEIGARTSGFIASHLATVASGHDYLFDYIDMLHGASIGNVDYINGDTSSMWYKYNIPTGSVCKKECCLPDYLSEEIKIMYCNRDGLVQGARYGVIENDNSCDREGFEMICGPKSVLTIDHIRESERRFLQDFCDYNKSLPEED